MGMKTLIALAVLVIHSSFLWAEDGGKKCTQLIEGGELKKAFAPCHKAAIKGDAEAQYNVGMLYGLGEHLTGITEDLDKEVYWYEKAASKGNAKAEAALGHIYEAQGDFSEAKSGMKKHQFTGMHRLKSSLE
ncbi:sel1 repeat family protein [Candidatus Parcubacteria bacterium]|nr:MAG: sel1 repeat family protein [Candidatus Parcubacteria bacterium]